VIGITGAAFVIGALSFLPGGLGVREATFTYLLYMVGVPIKFGLAVALIYKGIVYLVFGIGICASMLIRSDTIYDEVRKDNYVL
jgi:uncharacterized membrane protein YbhN (UPF0104 family)